MERGGRGRRMEEECGVDGTRAAQPERTTSSTPSRAPQAAETWWEKPRAKSKRLLVINCGVDHMGVVIQH
jgi:hypothetical protein